MAAGRCCHADPRLDPLFFHIPVPLEPTYQATWDASPEEMRIAVETGVLPDPDAA
jgi:hypothetical protein